VLAEIYSVEQKNIFKLLAFTFFCFFSIKYRKYIYNNCTTRNKI